MGEDSLDDQASSLRERHFRGVSMHAMTRNVPHQGFVLGKFIDGNALDRVFRHQRDHVILRDEMSALSTGMVSGAVPVSVST